MEHVGFAQHDHHSCIESALNAAQAFCEQQKLQLTPIRKRVLEILLERHRAMGAYDILEVLRDEGFGSQPPVAYRALDFLVQHGFAHKIERLNAFTACMHPGEQHMPAFLICRDCDKVVETHMEAAKNLLGKAVREVEFEVEQAVVEVIGLCPKCKSQA
ncbi:Fur family transcriptional regulator [Roseovarius sp. EL26]|uniref:Fur family transcriptional regulator n=1 Tax=Roseovarius sp. EL26 TaxID=2126672 RepID=UPI000EA3E102|nr:Fur family transcriptional regulator [Roseovarius sp. EL26]